MIKTYTLTFDILICMDLWNIGMPYQYLVDDLLN